MGYPWLMFPASWASKIAPCFIGEEGEVPSKPRKRFPLLVPIESLKGCRETRLTKYYRQLTKTPLD